MSGDPSRANSHDSNDTRSSTIDSNNTGMKIYKYYQP